MELIMFIKSPFGISQKRSPESNEIEKRRILVQMAQRYHHDGKGLLLLRATDVRKELASSGFIQILDGGNKELPTRAEWCVISCDGLNHLRHSSC